MWRVVLLGLALSPGLVFADEVFLRGGGQLTGQVVEKGPDSVLVDVGTGRIGVPSSSVERIVPGETPLVAYRQRAAGLAPDDAAGWLALGQWARERGLEEQARAAFQNALAADPGNAAAHRALGHVQLRGEWMTPEESLRARGYVLFEGAWITAERRQEILQERRAAADDRSRWAETEARAREAEARTREADAQARLAEVDAARAELELRRAEDQARLPWPGLWGGPWESAPVFPYSLASPLAFWYPGWHPYAHRHASPRGHGASPGLHGASLGGSLGVPGVSLGIPGASLGLPGMHRAVAASRRSR